ncbi:MAG: sugar phosphate isomerase/epimerase [Firmicutes bacterium]|nr:sugar phosphate isomerase/epimerase [Bacillota bacterium]
MALKVGIQLYSVRQSLGRDPYGTLAKVAEAGYKYIEAANHDATNDPGIGFGVPADKMKDSLERLGMSIVGCHIQPLRPELLGEVLDYHQAIGNPQIGTGIEFFPYNDIDFVLRQCELFNKVGEMCKERGMRYYYHNHYQEFQTFGDQTVYDIIMENTDPELVFMEMDTYWMMRGGQDPVELIKKYQDRLILLHQKDFPKDAPQPQVMYDNLVDPKANITMELFASTLDPSCFTEIGTGVLPIQEIIDAAQSAPELDYVILEQDHTRLDEIESIKVSMEAFRKFSGIEWS